MGYIPLIIFWLTGILLMWVGWNERKIVLVASGAMMVMGARSICGYIIRRKAGLHLNHRPWSWLKARLGIGKSVEGLAQRLQIPAEQLRHFVPRYQERFIAKRSGGKRRLLVPDAATKALQRRILRRLLQKLRAHPAACGFERGKSIADNAKPHVGRAVVLRMDIVDFFPTTQAERIVEYFRRIGWHAEAAALLTRLVTHDGGLPQGAPTSPRLSNLVNFYLDAQLTKLAANRKGTYTRYADDLTFSFPKDYPRRVRGVVQRLRCILRHKGYELHRHKKFSIRRRHQRQVVTGLVVNERLSLPRERRRWLRAVEHHLANRKRASITASQLAGWRAFEQMVERENATHQPLDR